MFTTEQEYLKQTNSFNSSYFLNFYLCPLVLLLICFKGPGIASKTTGQALPGAGHRVHQAQTKVFTWQILLVIECIVKWSTRLLLLQEVCDDRLTRKQGCHPFSSLRQISMGFLCSGHPPESPHPLLFPVPFTGNHIWFSVHSNINVTPSTALVYTQTLFPFNRKQKN